MRHSAWLFFLLFGVAPLTPPSLAQSPKSKAPSKALVDTPPMRVDPCYRRLASVDRLTAFSVAIPPRGTTLITPHPHDHVLIAISSINLEATGPSGISYPVRLADEEMQVMKGGWSHRLTNLADAPAQLLEIDVQNGIAPERALCGLAASPCTGAQFGKTDEGTYATSTLFRTPKVKLTKVELGPGGVLEKHGHSGSELLIALTPIHLKDDAGSDIKKNRGEIQAYPAGTDHQLQNLGSDAARFLELELK